MNDVHIYKPYRSETWIRFVVFPIGIAAFILAGYYWLISVRHSICMGAIGLLCIWAYKGLYNASNVVIHLEPQGLRIVERKNQNDICVQWEAYPYAHYATSYKGHLFLVLSSERLDDKEKKRLANRSANSSKVHVDDAIVIHLDNFQDVALIKAYVESHVMYVEPYR